VGAGTLSDQRRFEQVDAEHLAEYLSDMARRDKREVRSRLNYRPDHRASSWRDTIREQRRELEGMIEAGSLRRHALQILD